MLCQLPSDKDRSFDPKLDAGVCKRRPVIVIGKILYKFSVASFDILMLFVKAHPSGIDH